MAFPHETVNQAAPTGFLSAQRWIFSIQSTKKMSEKFPVTGLKA
jgi:hypothetical protein